MQMLPWLKVTVLKLWDLGIIEICWLTADRRFKCDFGRWKLELKIYSSTSF